MCMCVQTGFLRGRVGFFYNDKTGNHIFFYLDSCAADVVHKLFL